MNNKEDVLWARNYCVGFIDILGHKVSIGEHELVPKDKALHESFQADLRKTLNPLLWLKKTSDHFLALLANNKIDHEYPGASPEIIESIRKLAVTNTKRIHWSDGVIMYSAFDETNQIRAINSIYDIIGSLGFLMLDGLARGYPIRGGLEIGWGVEEDGNLYGKAVCSAYELESCIAGYPRVVIGRNLLSYLLSLAKSPRSTPEHNYDIDLAKECLDAIEADEDGVPIVHFLGKPFRGGNNLEEAFAIGYKHASSFVISEKSKFQSIGDNKLHKRYLQLENYFKRHPL